MKWKIPVTLEGNGIISGRECWSFIPPYCPLFQKLLALFLFFSFSILSLNPSKFEAVMLGTLQSLQKLGLTSVSLAGTTIPLTGHLKLLGVTLDSNLSIDKHISTVVRLRNCQLWSLRHLRHLLTVDVTAALCRCLILSRLDYCSSLLHQLSSASLQKL